jgi:phosphatidylserine decarboxylase
MKFEHLRRILVPIHPEGVVFVLISAFITFLLTLMTPVLGWLGAAFTGWVAYFFRDPPRVTPKREGLIISPADGMVTFVGKATPPKELKLGKKEWTRVSIFLNVFDVHINRIPIGGMIEQSIYHPGKFLNATLDKSSEDNERQSLVVRVNKTTVIPFVQIAGLIAKRIRCDAKKGDTYNTGERFGLIRFGSRTDVYLPEGVVPLVAEGQRMIGGETVIADLKSEEKPREGEIR